jgi:hypothetical protein
MRPVLLIAANFIRIQRWYVVLLLIWVFGSAAVFGLAASPPSRDDLLFYLRQQAAYAVALSLLTAAGAIHNDRRSRRILAVLSKAVERRQYIAGLLVGSLAIAAFYCVATGAVLTWLVARLKFPVASLWTYIGVLFAACILCACYSVLFGTFMNPVFSGVAAGLAIGTQVLLERALHLRLAPAFGVAQQLAAAPLGGWTASPWPATGAALEGLVLWAAASAIFAMRDVAIAVE